MASTALTVPMYDCVQCSCSPQSVAVWNMLILHRVLNAEHLRPSGILRPDEYALGSFVDSVCQEQRRFKDDLPRKASMLGHQSDHILGYVRFYVL